MGLARALLGASALLFTSGAIVMIILTFLGGTSNTRPENIIYFLQANTGNIPGAPAITRWTFWNACRVDDHGKSQCGHNWPDYPFDPPSHRNFGTTTNVPHQFIGTNHYFLMSRFMFPFCLLTIFFAVMSLFVGFAALFSKIAALIAAFLSWIALIFQVITTSLMTAVFVQGRNNFNRNGQPARLGRIAFGLMWASIPCLFLASMLFFIAGFMGRRKDGGYTGREYRRRGYVNSKPSSNARDHTDHTEVSTT